MIIFDTNAILRYILQDDQQKADTVENLLSIENCIIPVEVVAEIVYVLNKVYKIGRQDITQAIGQIIDIDYNMFVSCDVVEFALQTFAETKLDFVDCLLAAYAKIERYTVVTFDNELQKFISKIV